MGVHKNRANCLNNMTRLEITEAKMKVTLFVMKYESGCAGAIYCLDNEKIPSDKTARVVIKALTYLCIDFDYRYWYSGSCWSLRVWFK